MIPKIIHYCWFGRNPMPELAKYCIESWRKYCPDYEIIEWNEDNFDINFNEYLKEAFAAKKWAFVTDVVRLYALVTYGGIYMDTDVELMKPLDKFLELEAFSGFESEMDIPTGIMGGEKEFPLFRELLNDYEGKHFINSDGSYNTTTNVMRITECCQKKGLIRNNTLQIVDGFTLFPNDYFCPKDHMTGIVKITANTHTIHHFNGSWLSEEKKYQGDLRVKLCKTLPQTIARIIAKGLAILKFRVFKDFSKRYFR